MITYNLSINCVDGETLYHIISPEKSAVLGFLLRYDHEGATVALVKCEEVFETVIEDHAEIYKELTSDAK